MFFIILNKKAQKQLILKITKQIFLMIIQFKPNYSIKCKICVIEIREYI